MIDYTPDNVSVSSTAYFMPYVDATITELNKWWINEQTERNKNTQYYESKPVLDVFETNEYTHWSAWAHTEPERYVINIRPPESIDYNLRVFAHEVGHNRFPAISNEDHVSQISLRLYDDVINSFRYSRH